MKIVHLIPEDHDDEWHTTKSCWCDPIPIEIKLGVLVGVQRAMFHRERRTDKTEEQPPEEGSE